MIVAPPPPHTTSVDLFGQPARTAEVAGRPLGETLAVFRTGVAVHLPTMPFSDTLARVAARMKGRPGSLELAKTRRAGPLYLVPTAKGWVCVQGATFLTCHRGLLRQGVTYSFQSTAAGIAVYGIAADGVARVSLGSQTATVRGNVFFLARKMKLTSMANLPKTFGTLIVSYRDGRPTAGVPIR